MKNCGPLVVCVELQSSESFGFYLKDSAVQLVVSDTPGGIYLHMIAHNIELLFNAFEFAIAFQCNSTQCTLALCLLTDLDF